MKVTTTTANGRVQSAATAYLAGGLSILPIRADGSKAPVGRWTEYQSQRMTPETAARAFANGVGIGVIAGRVSGGLEIIDIDEEEMFVPFVNECEATEPGLLERLPCVRTPNGYHFYLRCDEIEGNQKLAQAADGKTLIETRGQGGYVLAPGCPPECHPSGRTYERKSGPRVAKTPAITPEERQILFRVARSFNEAIDEPSQPATPAESAGESPGDDYNRRATWQEILTPHGWAVDHESDGKTYWRRPGKDVGWSATAGCKSKSGNDLLCVFSTNASPFEGATVGRPCSVHSRFAAYATLEHGGDFSAAASDLAKQGYGASDEEPVHANPTHRSRRLTDYGNAERFVDLHAENVRYCHAWKKWLVWAGQRWELDESGAAARLAKDTVRTIYQAAARELDPDKRGRIAKWAYVSEQSARIAAMLKLAESEQPIPIAVDELDGDPWLFNCEDGTINLKTGELQPHSRGDLITKIAPVEYPTKPGVDAVLWLSFLDRIFDGNVELTGFVQRLAGLSLVGEVVDHALPILHGKGDNGKTVFVETLLGIFGDYGMKGTQELLMISRNVQHPTEKADLFGRRLVAAVESDDGRRLAESAVKEITGGDTISARHMKKDFFRFKPSHSPMLVTNHKPKVHGTDHSIWRRLYLVPFTVRIPKAEQDGNLARKLGNEWPAILRWIVAGCLEWQRDGLNPPTVIQAATAEYRRGEDVLGDFFDERCVIDPNDPKVEVLTADLYAAYEGWAEKNKEKVISKRAFGGRMTNRDEFERSQNCPRRYFGIRLKDD